MSALITTDATVAAAALRNGGLVAFPTETVYGLGADAASSDAVERIFTTKGRPRDHPIIVHVSDVTDVETWADTVPDYAHRLVTAFWPGPLTVVLPRRPGIGERAAAGLATIGLRSPAHPVAQELLAAFGGGVAAPSANRFGRVSPTTAAHVVSELADVLDPSIDRILDGGPCEVGVESTIVDCTGPAPRLLRIGSVTLEAVATTTGLDVAVGDGSTAAPGTLPSHYAPQARVVVVDDADLDTMLTTLLQQDSKPALGLMASAAIGDRAGVSRLAAPVDDAEYARVLYSALRAADDVGLDVVVAVPPPDRGVGSAVGDRLRRAAHGSPRS